MRKFLWRTFLLTVFFSLIFIALIAFVVNNFTFSFISDVLIHYQYQNTSLIIYLFFLAFILSLLLSFRFSRVERKKMKKVSKALSKLVDNQIRDPLFIEMYSKNTNVKISKKVDQLVLELHEKIAVMAEEARLSKEEAVKINDKTKEEILEGERHRIARELHDSVSQQLFASAMMLSAVNEQSDKIPKPIADQLKVIEGITNDSQSEMRALLLHLRPVTLNDKTLKEGIEQLLSELKTKVKMDISYYIETIKMPATFEDHLFRIVQELISNVLRHAKASEIELYLEKTSDSIQLRVIDDGVGFDVDKTRAGSYGLQNIRERVEGVGGKVKIVSIKDMGTSVNVDFPFGIGGDVK